MMRNLLILVVVVAGLWSVWWYTGASAHETGIKTWLSGQRDKGWVADYQGLEVKGYPNRFDTTVTDLNLADPFTGWAWSAPDFQILSQAYTPNHIIAVWPKTQTLSTPEERVELETERMQGSVVFEANTGLALNRSAIDITGLDMVGATGWKAQLDRGFLATRQAPDGSAPDYAHDVNLQATTLVLPRPLKIRLDPAGILPEEMERAVVDLTVAFDAPWDRGAVESGDLPRVTALNLRDLTITWGELLLVAKGEIQVDRNGYPVGAMDVTAKNWTDMVDLAVEGGLIDRGLGDTVLSGLSLLARFSDDPDTLEVPLQFSGGFTKLGPIPIGPAPRFRR